MSYHGVTLVAIDCATGRCTRYTRQGWMGRYFREGEIAVFPRWPMGEDVREPIEIFRVTPERTPDLAA